MSSPSRYVTLSYYYYIVYSAVFASRFRAGSPPSLTLPRKGGGDFQDAS